MEDDLITAAKAIGLDSVQDAGQSLASERLPLLAPKSQRAKSEWASQIVGYSSSSESDVTSDEEEDNKSKNAAAHAAEESDDEIHGLKQTSAEASVLTRNEIAPPPSSIVDNTNVEGNIRPLGHIMSIVEATIVIQSFKGLPAMDEDSILCLEDGKPIGTISEVFGPIYEPLYLIRFPSSDMIGTELQVGVTVCFVEQQAKPIDTRNLVTKGSDASNAFDEEPGDDEIEFSDDEAEAHARRMHKANRRRPSPDPDAFDVAVCAAEPAAAASAGRGRGGRGGGAVRGRGSRGRGGRGSSSGERRPQQAWAGQSAPAWPPSQAPAAAGFSPAWPPSQAPAAAGSFGLTCMLGHGPGLGLGAATPFGYNAAPAGQAGLGFMAPSFGPGSRPVFAGAGAGPSAGGFQPTMTMAVVPAGPAGFCPHPSAAGPHGAPNVANPLLQPPVYHQLQGGTPVPSASRWPNQTLPVTPSLPLPPGFYGQVPPPGLQYPPPPLGSSNQFLPPGLVRATQPPPPGLSTQPPPPGLSSQPPPPGLSN